jgi:hypothetical protein
MSILYFVLALVSVGAVWQIVNTRVSLPASTKTILNVVFGLILIGMVLWFINTYIPMAGSIRAILNIVVVVATCVRVLQALGLWSQITRLWGNVTAHRLPR